MTWPWPRKKHCVFSFIHSLSFKSLFCVYFEGQLKVQKLNRRLKKNIKSGWGNLAQKGSGRGESESMEKGGGGIIQKKGVWKFIWKPIILNSFKM